MLIPCGWVLLLACDGVGVFAVFADMMCSVPVLFSLQESEVYPVAERMKKDFKRDWGQVRRRFIFLEQGA